ncbi:MAG: hypothetical protein ACLSUM_10690 [Dysosmobacter welbionis]
MEELEAFQKGLFYIRIRPPVWRCWPPARRRMVLDVCAPRRQVLAAAIQMEDRGEVVSCDLHPHKDLIHRGAERLGLSCVRPSPPTVRRTGGGSTWCWWTRPAPGWGDPEKPDIRYKDGPLASCRRSERHSGQCRAYAEAGRVLLYSTCTILRRRTGGHRPLLEGIGVCPGGLLSRTGGEVPEGQLTLWPQVHGTDGFYLCRLRKEG